MSNRIYARYWIETAFPLQQAAEVLAGEQSSGTFVRVPGETDELRARSGARVEEIVELDTVATPSLPGAGVPKGGGTVVYAPWFWRPVMALIRAVPSPIFHRTNL